jgi:hypothetical protein
MLIQVSERTVVQNQAFEILDLLPIHLREIDLTDIPIDPQLRLIAGLEMDIRSSMPNRLAYEMIEIENICHLVQPPA